MTLAVVVSSPADTRLIGSRVTWDGSRLSGSLGGTGSTEAVRALLASEPPAPASHPVPGTDIEVFVERVAARPTLVIVGAGHIAQPLAEVGKMLDFDVTVLDDRPEFARRERFPDADRVLVADFADPFADIVIDERTHVVLVTRGHRYDYDCMRILAGAPARPAYIGMIGSRRRVRAAFEQLVEEGVDHDWLAWVHAPIGLDIGSETPAEIAVAVAAEIVREARGGTGERLRDEHDVVRRMRARAKHA